MHGAAAMTTARQTGQHSLEEVRTMFLARSLAEIDSLQPLKARLRAGDGETVRQMGQWGHRVSGMAAVLGIREVSSQGEEIEKIARAAGRNPRVATSESQRIERAIDIIAARLRALTRSCARQDQTVSRASSQP